MLINGVTGSLGVAAVQMALALGVKRVLGIGRRPEILEQVRQLDPSRVMVTSYDGDATVKWVRDQHRRARRGHDV